MPASFSFNPVPPNNRRQQAPQAANLAQDAGSSGAIQVPLARVGALAAGQGAELMPAARPQPRVA